MAEKFRDRLISFLGLNTSILAMMIMVVFIGLGEKMAERFLPVYIIAIGGSIYAVSILNGLDNLLSALYSLPGGYLSDRIGYKKALIVFTLTAMFGYAIVIFVPTWQAVIIGAIFFISWTSISLPAIMSMVSSITARDKRIMGVTIHSLTRRIPMALGPIIGGIVITSYGNVQGIKIAFSAALLLGFFAIIFIHFLMKEPVREKEPKKFNAADVIKNINPNLRTLLVSDILIRFAEQIPYPFVVIWVMSINGFSAAQFGILTAIEMATAMIVYLPVAYFADRGSKKPYIVITFAFFAIFPLILCFAKSFELLIAAFIIRGLKEFGEPTRKALITELAPEDMKAAMFGAYYFTRDIFVSIAAFSAAFLWVISPYVNFIAAFAFGLIGTIYFGLFGKNFHMPQTGKHAN
ncbi:MAG: MFS transporter [Ignavibacteriales bacterium]|nr:MFS transporter [Ignavibacteriales bacterium]